jgi:hypothetical protein
VPNQRRVPLPVLSLSDRRLLRRHRAKGGVFAFAPTFALRGTSSTKSPGAEDIADGGDAALARSGSAGVFDVTVD